MFNTSILDVAIGMVFIYLLLSLLCTATNELIELLLKKREIDLSAAFESFCNLVVIREPRASWKKSTTIRWLTVFSVAPTPIRE